MAGHHTQKTEISYEDYLKLEGLLVLGREANKECDRIIRAVAGIVGEDPYNPGHAADAVYGSSYSARDLLRKSAITVLPPTEVVDG